jgi:acetyl-CoA synthetase
VSVRGTPDFPDKDRWWDIVERYKVTILYTAPTAIRAHMKWGPSTRRSTTSRRFACSARSGADQPRGVDVVPRAHRGDRTPIVDTWWQTETGMIMITPLPA